MVGKEAKIARGEMMPQSSAQVGGYVRRAALFVNRGQDLWARVCGDLSDAVKTQIVDARVWRYRPYFRAVVIDSCSLWCVRTTSTITNVTAGS